jgi:hypothetical protein
LIASVRFIAAGTPAFAQVLVKAGAAEITFSSRVQFPAATCCCTDATPAVDSACQ